MSQDIIVPLAVIVIWAVLNIWVLPAMGVPT